MKRFLYPLAVAFLVTSSLLALGLACWLWLETREQPIPQWVIEEFERGPDTNWATNLTFTIKDSGLTITNTAP